MYNNDFVYVERANKKLLYVVVFIAALVVATLSGTYAYFQASATDDSTITGTIADVGITLEIDKLTSSSKGTAANGTTLIPFDLLGSNTLTTSSLTDTTTGAFPNGCIDSDGYTACDVFRIGIKANNQIKINGYLRINPYTDTDAEVTSYIPNVKWILLGSRNSSGVNYIEQLTSSIYNTTDYLLYSKAIGSTTSDDATGDTLFTGTTANDSVITTSMTYYYIMVWLEDTGDYQEDEGTYKGTVTFRGQGDTEGQITANFG